MWSPGGLAGVGEFGAVIEFQRIGSYSSSWQGIRYVSFNQLERSTSLHRFEQNGLGPKSAGASANTRLQTGHSIRTIALSNT